MKVVILRAFDYAGAMVRMSRGTDIVILDHPGGEVPGEIPEADCRIIYVRTPNAAANIRRGIHSSVWRSYDNYLDHEGFYTKEGVEEVIERLRMISNVNEKIDIYDSRL